MNNETEIRTIIAEWAIATKQGRKNDVLLHHSANAIVYDPLPPLRYMNAADYRKSFDKWWPETIREGLFELEDLQVFNGDDTAFAHALLRCGGTHPDGERFEDLVRLTICLRKLEGEWKIVHQHTSMPMPIQMDDGE